MGVHAFPQRIYTNDSFISYWQELNLQDGSWTLQDTNNFIHKDTWDGTQNVIELKAVASGTDDYAPTGNGTGVTNAPRWYKPAYYDNGQPVLAGDLFQITMVTDMQGTTSGNLRYFNWFFGLAEDATSSNIGALNMNGIGIGWNFANTAADVFAVQISGAGNQNSSPLSNDDTLNYGTIQSVGGQTNMSNVSTDPSGTYKAWIAYSSITAAYGGGQLNLCLIAGMRGGSRSYSLGDETSFKIKYKISKLKPGAL